MKAKKVAHTKSLECMDEDEKWRPKDIYKMEKTEAKSVVMSAKIRQQHLNDCISS